VGLVGGGVLFSSGSFSSADISESSESTRTSEGSYSLLSARSRSIPSVSLEALTTRALLAWASRRCQSRMRLFWLTRCVGRPLPLIAIALADMTWPGVAKSRMKRLRSLLACAITFSLRVNVIVVGLSW